MEGEKDNYRECYSTQEEAKVGDIPVVAVLGVEKGQQAVAETPPPFSPLQTHPKAFDPPSPPLPVLSLSRPCRHHSISWR